jgi:hypothetical protein
MKPGYPSENGYRPVFLQSNIDPRGVSTPLLLNPKKNFMKPDLSVFYFMKIVDRTGHVYLSKQSWSDFNLTCKLRYRMTLENLLTDLGYRIEELNNHILISER